MLGELAGVLFVGVELALSLGRSRGTWWWSLFGLEVRVGHGLQAVSKSLQDKHKRRTQQSVECRLDIATTGHQDSADDLGVDCGKGLLERLLVLRLGAQGARRLGRSIFILNLDEADLLRGRALERTAVVVIIVEVKLACCCWRLGACFLRAGCVSLGG